MGRVESGLARLLADLAEALDCQAGVLWLLRGDRLSPRVLWHAETDDLGEFKLMTLTSRLPRGAEVPGQAWQLLAPSGLTSSAESASPRWRAAQAAGYREAIAFPAMWADDLIGVIELLSRQEPEVNDRLKRSLAAIGYVLGYFLARRRGLLFERVITDRQVEILRLSAQGLSARQIAERLGVSPTTVKSHFENIYVRLGVKHRAAAVAEAMRLGLVE